MTTTELIELLKANEFGGITGKPREISIDTDMGFMPNPTIIVTSTGDGMLGAEITLTIFEEKVEGENIDK